MSEEHSMERQAARVAHDLLTDELPRRYRHVEGVAVRAAALAGPDESCRDMLAAAGWLHDIGYSPTLVVSGFHPIDGARWLYENGWSDRLCSLVAHHTAARYEADLRGLSAQLARWPEPERDYADILTVADLTTNADGTRCSVDERVADIYARYDPDHVVHRALIAAEDEMRAVCARVDYSGEC